MVLIFDLDDTLYDEINYVKSGFRAVAEFASITWAIPIEEAYTQMLETLEKMGRGYVFNELLNRYGKLTQKNVKKCLSAYRLHQPNIQLPSSSIDCFQRFKDRPKYIVTDGNKIVQYNKVKALGVEKYVKKAYITSRYGLKNAKPSPYCFLQIATLEKEVPKNIVYIGDNPNKDFVGIKPLGFKTIRINNGMFKDLKKEPAYQADIQINSLDELNIDLLSKLIS